MSQSAANRKMAAFWPTRPQRMYADTGSILPTSSQGEDKENSNTVQRIEPSAERQHSPHKQGVADLALAHIKLRRQGGSVACADVAALQHKTGVLPWHN